MAIIQKQGSIAPADLHRCLEQICSGQHRPLYEFVLLRNVPWSFTAAHETHQMVSKGFIIDAGGKLKVTFPEPVILRKEDHLLLELVMEKSGVHVNRTLTFLQGKVENINDVLYTIGYEGVSLEHYLNKLIANNIRLLIDTRSNAYSMKFGFSKALLNNFCIETGMLYKHIPGLGTPSALRKDPANKNLIAEYREVMLHQTKSYQADVIKLINKHHRVALTCFEADINQCHRKPLSEAIQNQTGVSLVHL